MGSLQKQFEKDSVPKLQKELGYPNRLGVPRLQKVVINVGLGRMLQDKALIEVAKGTLKKISGQAPVQTKAKKSISGFKIRAGMTVGLKVTLRGKRMYDFIEKLIRVSFPRIQDFRGISEKTLDKSGNLAVGFKEHIVFPEIKSDEVEHLHGLEVCITTTAKNRKEGMALFTLLGFPFKKE